ncbi:peptide deformylase [Arthrobacter russicus]|uniref:Peptide deformylase n=1 Tax=Arthrobacter russicus TaxID=172040 RepID=A0ABU1J8Z2_9MICC|nr:peptide deformylase [Arthrobacter russicus]MDR6267857.1 peptide deformylase [Arthrobacter russicus]
MAENPSAPLQDQVAAMLAAAADGVLPAIVQAGHPALRTPAARWTCQLEPAQLTELIDLLRRCMHAAPGVGLAAPQLGISLQLAVLEDRHLIEPEAATLRERTELEFFAVLNPRYEALGPEMAEFYEGCLSVDGWQAVVPRHRAVGLHFESPDGVAQYREFSGWPARIVQHETDHLAGELYLDKAILRSLASNAEYAARWAEPGIGLAQRGLGF